MKREQEEERYNAKEGARDERAREQERPREGRKKKAKKLPYCTCMYVYIVWIYCMESRKT